jgi:hypothetical protein
MLWKRRETIMRKPRKKFSPSSNDDEISDLGTSQPSSSEVGTSSGYVGEYCPIIGRRCTELACEDCKPLHKKYKPFSWLCSSCSRDIILPFWGDVPCEICGLRRWKKGGEKKRERKRKATQ